MDTWEWQEDRRVDLQPGRNRYNTGFMASLDLKTAFDVAKPSLVSKILTLTGVHGRLTAALLAEIEMSVAPQSLRTVRQNSGTLGASAKEVRRHLCSGDALPNMCSGELRKSGEPKAGRLSFGGQHGNEYTLRSMMWVDNYWMFSDNREKLICMVNDIVEELLDLDVEPKPESLWWTSTQTVLNGSINWPSSGAMINEVRAWEGNLGNLQNKNITVHEDQLDIDGTAVAD